MLVQNETMATQGYTLSLADRESVEINLNLAKDTIELLEEIAKKKDLSVISIIKFFIGKGIRFST